MECSWVHSFNWGLIILIPTAVRPHPRVLITHLVILPFLSLSTSNDRTIRSLILFHLDDLNEAELVTSCLVNRRQGTERHAG